MNGGIIDASGSVVLRVAAGMGPTHNDPEMFDTADDAAPSHRATPQMVRDVNSKG